MSDELIPSFEPQEFIENKELRQRQPQISQRTQDRIAISQEAYRWSETFGFQYGREILETLLDDQECKTDSPEHKATFTETLTQFLIRLYTLKLEHELILTILKLTALLIAGLLCMRRLYRRTSLALTPPINSRTDLFLVRVCSAA